jgi:hypothetical protein
MEDGLFEHDDTTIRPGAVLNSKSVQYLALRWNALALGKGGYFLAGQDQPWLLM